MKGSPWCACGLRKSRSSERCHDCRYLAGWSSPVPLDKRRPRISEELLAEARRLYDEERMPFMRIAGRLFEAAGYRSVASCKSALQRTFARRGWPTREPVA